MLSHKLRPPAAGFFSSRLYPRISRCQCCKSCVTSTLVEASAKSSRSVTCTSTWPNVLPRALAEPSERIRVQAAVEREPESVTALRELSKNPCPDVPPGPSPRQGLGTCAQSLPSAFVRSLQGQPSSTLIVCLESRGPRGHVQGTLCLGFASLSSWWHG